MADETQDQTPKELTPEQKFRKATEDYFAAIQKGDKKLAEQIHRDNKLPWSVGNHS